MNIKTLKKYRHLIKENMSVAEFINLIKADKLQHLDINK